jgi:hypothetical protein
MPRFSTWSIRLALVYLATGVTIGALLLFHKGVSIAPILWRLLPAHIDFLLFGWIVQLVMGVAYWILPRFSSEPRRGNVPLAWAAVVSLNIGILFAGLGPAMAAPPLLAFLGRAAEFGAAVTFAVHAWPRVKGLGDR